MRRRFFLIAPFALRVLAKPLQSTIDLFASIASSLSEGNTIAFLEAFDLSMPNFEKLASEIAALAAQAEVVSSIEILLDEGDDNRRSVEVDWLLEIRSKQESGPLERRRDLVKCQVERQKKRSPAKLYYR